MASLKLNIKSCALQKKLNKVNAAFKVQKGTSFELQVFYSNILCALFLASSIINKSLWVGASSKLFVYWYSIMCLLQQIISSDISSDIIHKNGTLIVGWSMDSMDAY